METIDISGDSVVVLKHHGSYMQQNRDLQRTDKAGYAQSYQVHTRPQQCAAVRRPARLPRRARSLTAPF
jgi:hypothetical protein